MAVSFLEDALEISSPWFVKDCRFDKDLGGLIFFLTSTKGPSSNVLNVAASARSSTAKCESGGFPDSSSIRL